MITTAEKVFIVLMIAVFVIAVTSLFRSLFTMVGLWSGIICLIYGMSLLRYWVIKKW